MAISNYLVSPYIHITSPFNAKQFLIRRIVGNMTYGEKRKLVWLRQEALAALDNGEDSVCFSQAVHFELPQSVIDIVELSGYKVKLTKISLN